MNKSDRVATGILAGALVGAIAGLVLAPKTGKETRAMIASEGSRFKGRAEYYVGNLKDRFNREPVLQGMEDHTENGTHNNN